MKFTILVHTQSYRGDHSADITRSFAPVEGETVEALVERVLGESEIGDRIEIIRMEDRA